MDAQNELASGFAYVREALAARMTESCHDPARDASLALTILGLLAAYDSRRVSDAPSRNASSSVQEPAEEGPYVINFERAKAQILARRRLNSSTAAPSRAAEDARPRLRIYRGD